MKRERPEQIFLPPKQIEWGGRTRFKRQAGGRLNKPSALTV